MILLDAQPIGVEGQWEDIVEVSIEVPEGQQVTWSTWAGVETGLRTFRRAPIASAPVPGAATHARKESSQKKRSMTISCNCGRHPGSPTR